MKFVDDDNDVSLKHGVRATQVTPLKQQKSLCFIPRFCVNFCYLSVFLAAGFIFEQPSCFVHFCRLPVFLPVISVFDDYDLF